MIARTRPSVTLYVHCLSCLAFTSEPTSILLATNKTSVFIYCLFSLSKLITPQTSRAILTIT
jgi:hypothetical protein